MIFELAALCAEVDTEKVPALWWFSIELTRSGQLFAALQS
ncbi:hypothetical protein EDO6_03376 [Paenibacillus xylanexedens]|nr:hypothetical protein EDO6_03376 [Paenibacillus xylanexedens]